MKKLVFAALLTLGTVVNAQAPMLTAAEKAEGWKLLFDGKSLAGWRGYKTETPPTGWRAENGVLIRDGEGGDLMTAEQYGDFEMRFEWKITQNGNSGIIYRIGTTEPYPWHTGPEYQILAQRRSRRRQEPDHLGGIELRGQCADQGRHQAGRRMERRPPDREGQSRRALAERREGRRVRDRQRRLEGARQGEQVRQDSSVRHGQARLHRAAGPRNVVVYRNLKIKPL